eukprot:TRINITY_DN5397_c0_g1_i6.p1 TRINITY_DN5397_c0_g1~~TRINITY_DN5397_c0_g1_i6.p1  ORF type:complete len:281 (+),score=17.22 TRINITY_DN5397_c0_g1_i6:132-974(+)
MGAVSFNVVMYYIRSMGSSWWAGAGLALFAMAVGFRSGAAFWLSVWTSTDDTYPHYSVGLSITVYILLCFGESVAQFIGQVVFALGSVQASRAIHDNMLMRLLHAPMRFFHQNPIGRLLNRFTKDTKDVDGSTMPAVTIFLQGFLGLIGTLIVIGVALPYMLAVFVLILYFFWRCYLYFQSSCRELKRLDAITRSPVYAHFSQCLQGLSSIRAYRAQHRLIREYNHKVDNNLRFDLATYSCNRWLTIRLSLLGGTVVLISEIGRAVQQECRDRSRMPSSA